jgi:hypothetical protein
MAALFTATANNGSATVSTNTNIAINTASSTGSVLNFSVFPNPGAGDYQINWMVKGLA